MSYEVYNAFLWPNRERPPFATRRPHASQSSLFCSYELEEHF